MVGVEDGFDYAEGPGAPRNGPDGSHIAKGSARTRSSQVDVLSRETPADSLHAWTHAHLNGMGDETNDATAAEPFLSEKKVKSIVKWLEEVGTPPSEIL